MRGKPSRMKSGSSSTSAEPPSRAWPTRWIVDSRTSAALEERPHGRA